MSIENKINDIKEELSLFPTEELIYEYLIDRGRNIQIEDKYFLEKYKVEGCISQVWLVPFYSNNKIEFKAYSDSKFVSGLLSILIYIFSNEKPEDIISFNEELLKTLNINEIITQNRRNGFSSVLSKIKEYSKNKIN